MKRTTRLFALLMSALLLLASVTACSKGDTASAKASSALGNSKATSSAAGTDASSSAAEAEADPVSYADAVSFRSAESNKQVKNLKILPVGDSLTYGSGTLSGWRYETYKRLYAAGITFEFVGPYQSEWDARLSDRYNKHGGWSGRKIQDVLDRADEIFKREFDVVFLMIGYNDKSDLSSKPELYRSLLDRIYTYNSGATVFCMGVAPDFGGAAAFDSFNDSVKAICEEMNGAGRAVYFVSTASEAWDPYICFTDYVHFSEEGNAVVADCLTSAAIPVLQKLNVPDSSYTLPVAATGLTLNANSLSLTAFQGYGEGGQLTAAVTPSNAEVSTVVWGSSDRRVATVDENGTVRAVGEGQCTVTAYTLDGGHKASCAVTVKKDAAGTVLFDNNFRDASEWTGERTANIKFGRFTRVKTQDSVPLTTAKTFDAGTRFYLSMDARVYRYNQSLRSISDNGYVALQYGNLEVRENKNGHSLSVLCDGQTVCEYSYGTFTVDTVEYGLLYDNGKVTLLRNGVAVASGNATAKVAGSAVSILSAEPYSTVNVTRVQLVRL